MSSSPAPRGAPSLRQLVLAIVVLCAIWGSAWLVIKDGLAALPPLLSASLRFLIAGAVMTAVVPALQTREGGQDPPTWLWVLIATCNFALAHGVIYYAQQFLPSGVVSVLWAVYPLLMAACGHFFLAGEKVGRLQSVGFALGFLGIILLFRGDLAPLGERARGAAWLLLLSPAASAFGTTVLKRHGAQVCSLKLNRNAMFFGGVLLFACSRLRGEPIPTVWEPRALFGMIYLSVFGTVLTLGLYYWALRYVSANRMSLVAYVTPAIALFLGWGLANESIYWTTILGALLIVSGLAFATRRPLHSTRDGIIPSRVDLRRPTESTDPRHV